MASGTHLDISYYTRDNIDQYHQEDIIQYFKDAESDDLDTAMKTLGENEYEEEEVRLMRIQFLSEVGN